MSSLLCQVKGHLACYCSCFPEDALCCGCGTPRKSITGKTGISLHCLDCEENLSSYTSEYDEDTTKFVRSFEELRRARKKFCRKNKVKFLGSK